MNTEDTLLKIKELVSKIETEIKQDKISNDEKLNQAIELITSVVSEVENLGATYQIPGIKLENTLYEYTVVKHIPDPNIELSKSIQTTINQIWPDLKPILKDETTEVSIVDLLKKCLIKKKDKGAISPEYEKAYQNFKQTQTEKEILLQPTIGALSDDKNIYTSICFFENYDQEITMEDFQIYQNFTINQDGNSQLSYYICFNIQNKERSDTYRMHKFLVKNKEINCNFFSLEEGKSHEGLLDTSKIKNVMVTVIDVDPETSRGTTTTVKPTMKD